jgi:erythritol transport system permease protein
MSVTNASDNKSVSNGQKRKFDLVRLILEGRAFFALIVIIAVFSFRRPTISRSTTS